MKNKKPTNLPPANGNHATYAELLVAAMRCGLGMSHPNTDGRWSWYDADFSAAVGCTPRTLQNWKTGGRPSKKHHASMLEAISHEEPHYQKWKDLFDAAYNSIKSSPTPHTTTERYRLGELAKSYNTYAEQNFRERLSRLTSQPPCIIGPSYLDVILSPITTKRLHPDLEYSSLGSPEVLLGGSSVFIGRYHAQMFKKKSDLFTLEPRNSSGFAKLWHERLAEETWINSLHPVGQPEEPPITFALRHARDGAKTMFTYPSDKHLFTWSSIMEALSGSDSRLLHLSGIVKTGLRDGFLENLGLLSKDHIVLLDHGRFTPDIKERDYQYLIQEAIDFGFVDIQITGVRDFASLYDIEVDDNLAHAPVDDRRGIIEAALERRGACERTITIIRDYDYQLRAPIFSIVVYGNLIHIDHPTDHAVRFPEGFAYASNKFNAALLGQLPDHKIDNFDIETAMLSLVESAYRNLVLLPGR